MKKIFDTRQDVPVSFFDKEGWWIKNGTDHVFKKTSVSAGCTEVVYTPSSADKTAKFNKATNSWEAEITDNRKIEIYNIRGERLYVRYPDTKIPKDAVKDKPPVTRSNQSVLRESGKWKIYDNHIGKRWWDRYFNTQVVSDPYFVLKENQTFDPKPDDASHKGDHVYTVENHKWVKIPNLTGKFAYNKATGEPKLMQLFSQVADTHTLSKFKPHHKWDSNSESWVLDKHEKDKATKELEQAWAKYEIVRINEILYDDIVAKQYNEPGHVSLTDDQVNAMVKYKGELKKHSALASFDGVTRPTI